jgi:hypothetical protein
MSDILYAKKTGSGRLHRHAPQGCVAQCGTAQDCGKDEEVFRGDNHQPLAPSHQIRRDTIDKSIAAG